MVSPLCGAWTSEFLDNPAGVWGSKMCGRESGPTVGNNIIDALADSLINCNCNQNASKLMSAPVMALSSDSPTHSMGMKLGCRSPQLCATAAHALNENAMPDIVAQTLLIPSEMIPKTRG